ncbi:MAG: response regulator transcription factor [Acidimicrobiales bacterium]
MGETTATILIVDDEAGVRDLLGDALRIAGYETLVAGDGDEALTLWRTNTVELCIVDVNMPTMNGFEFVESVRREDAALPILLLSARDAAVDVAHGLRIGADDYVRKPFSLEELLLRVAAILRRTSGATEDDRVLRCGPLAMNVDRHEVTIGEELVDMSATEFRLLEVLLGKKNHLLTREQLLRDVWDITFDSETSVLDTYISYLRKKIHRDDFAPITTVRGVGFKLVDPRPSA